MSIAPTDRKPEAERTMTVGEALKSVGRWVAVRPRLEPAIVINAVGISVLIRYATDRGNYHATGVDMLVRRPEWDSRPEPRWLAEARVSTRPPRHLRHLLFPERPTQAVVDELTYRSYSEQRLRNPEIEPERWAVIYGGVATMEARFQEEQELARELDERVVHDAGARR